MQATNIEFAPVKAENISNLYNEMANFFNDGWVIKEVISNTSSVLSISCKEKIAFIGSWDWIYNAVHYAQQCTG